MNRNSMVPRGFIKFLQYLGTFLSVLTLVVTITTLAYMENVKLWSDQDKIAWSLLIAVEVYMVWKSIYAAFVIIRYMNRSSDDEIIANRFIMSVLSLGVGGFVTPFVLTSLPKTQSSSTINPRVFLAKHLGFTMLVGFVIFAIIMIALPMGYEVSFNTIISNTYGYIALGIAAIAILIGLLGVSLFSSKNAQEHLGAKNGLGFLMQFVGIIYAIIATVEMVLMIVMAIVRLIAVVSNSIERLINGDGIEKMFAVFALIFNLTFQMMYVTMISKICIAIIQGLWAKEQVIIIQQFSKVQEAEVQQKTKNGKVSAESF